MCLGALLQVAITEERLNQVLTEEKKLISVFDNSIHQENCPENDLCAYYVRCEKDSADAGMTVREAIRILLEDTEYVQFLQEETPRCQCLQTRIITDILPTGPHKPFRLVVNFQNPTAHLSEVDAIPQ